MPTIEGLTRRPPPVAPDTPASAVLARLIAEPDALALAVVGDDGRPVGLVERSAFLLQLAGPFGQVRYLNRPVSLVMDAEPAVIEAGVEIDAFCDSLMRAPAAALTRGYIVTRKGRYHGVGTGAELLKALNDDQRRRNDELSRTARALADGEVRARDAARSRGRFVAMLGQEVRNPLNGVLAVAELLRRQPLAEATREHVGTIVDSAETVLHILSEAQDLARAEAGELELVPAPTPLRALMDEVEAQWAARAAQDGVTLMVGYQGDTELAAQIDAARLKQVFNKLIGNALRYARNGVVEAGLRARADQGRVRLEGRVRDDGPGVDPERLETLFHPDDAHAAGLGLSICRRLIKRMDGTIAVTNNDGRGATFAFDLTAPQAVIAAPAASNVSALPDMALPAQPHVLIVDDNATNRVVAQALCEMFGCSSETAEDGVEAVEAVRLRAFDLILMDIKMPRMDGVGATLAIRALPGPEALTPIVALTANADPEDAKRYVSIGMAAVVEKPIKPERLRLAMTLALSEPAAQADAAPTAAVRAA